MVEPVALEHFFLFFFVSALVILSALGYTVLFAMERVSKHANLRVWVTLAYLVLAASIVWLAYLANLQGFWLLLVGLLLAGFGVGPVIIWRLCVATHGEEGAG